MTSPLLAQLVMHFPRRFAEIRKERGLTQRQMTDQVSVHVSQFKRYEASSSQPTLEVFERIVVALTVGADALLLDVGERGPKDEHLRPQFESVGKLAKQERGAVQTLIDGVPRMHDAKRYTTRVGA